MHGLFYRPKNLHVCLHLHCVGCIPELSRANLVIVSKVVDLSPSRRARERESCSQEQLRYQNFEFTRRSDKREWVYEITLKELKHVGFVS